MMNERHNLVKIIAHDLFRTGKWPLLLLFIALFSALAVVMTTQKTRTLVAEREQLIMERQEIDIEWRNLILEENVLADHWRIERLAVSKLKMQHIDPNKENIIILK